MGPLTLANRLVMPAMGTRYADFGGWASDQLTGYLCERSIGGAGLVTVEMTAVTFAGRISNYSPGMYHDRLIPGWKKLTRSVKAAGAKVAVQLAHGGSGSGSAATGVQAVAPSSIARLKGEVPRELTVKEIDLLVEAFASAAGRAQQAGFDAVELHMAHGYLIDQFLSPLTNRRTDAYGGDVERRSKFALDILRRCKETAGKGLAVICRLTGDQFMEDGLGIEDSKIIAKMLEKAGADAVHVTGGSLETIYMSAPPMAVSEGCLVPLAQEIKKVVKVPVIAVGKIRDPYSAEEILRSGKADMVAIGRGMIADPFFVKKASEDRSEEIRPCISCNNPQCHGRTAKNLDMGCVVNPVVGRELELKIEKAGAPKKVLIIGAGPAGLEAARVLSLRGHRVVVCEKDSAVGGQLRFGCVPPYKEEIRKLIRYYEVQLKTLQVDLRTGSEVTPQVVNTLAPDTVIVATGGKYRLPDVKNIERYAVNAGAVLAKAVPVGQTVVIIGGGDVGCETAEYLARKGKKVTVLEMMPEPPSEYLWWTKKLQTDRLSELNVQLITSAKAVAVEKGVVRYERGGISHRIESVDTIVIAAGMEANADLTSRIPGVPCHVIGDAKQPGNIGSAIRQGFETALTI